MPTAVGVTIFLLTYILPKFEPLFSRKGETEKKISFLSERRAALAQQRDDPGKYRTQITFADAAHMGGTVAASAHHLALHQAGIDGRCRNKIEMGSGIGHDLFSRRQVALQHLQHTPRKRGKSY